MNELVNKLSDIARDLSTANKAVTLFALFKLEDSVWLDIVVAAPWIKADDINAMREIASRVQNTLNLDDLWRISGIKLLDERSPVVRDARKLYGSSSEVLPFRNQRLGDLDIVEGYIITAEPLDTSTMVASR